MALLTDSRFSTRFGLGTPLALAPMALASGGALASSSSFQVMKPQPMRPVPCASDSARRYSRCVQAKSP